MIVFASTLNNKYYKGACVTLNTLRKNISVIIPYHIFLFEDISAKHKQVLRSIYPNIIFHNIEDSCYDDYSLCNEFRDWDYNVFNRFEIFTLDASRVIFLDFDLLITRNIDELISYKCTFGAVERYNDDFNDYINVENFDAGVMIIDQKFISLNTKTRLMELSRLRKWSSDEPVLNIFFNRHWSRLPQEYNVLTPFYSSTRTHSIIQFVGIKKPWYDGALEERYDEYVLLNNDIKKLIALDNNYKKELLALSEYFGHLS